MLLQNQLQNQIKNILSTEYQYVCALGQIPIEMPQNEQYGHLSSTIALQLAKPLRQSPIKIAETIAERLQKIYEDKISISVIKPGFLNFNIESTCLWAEQVLELSREGLIPKISSPQKILLEYVSANPTGDLHLGHGRGAVIGSALAEILRVVGHDVHTEFYLNDAGEQIEKLYRSAWHVHKNIPITENEYPTELIEPYVPDVGDDVEQRELGELTQQNILKKQKEVLSNLRVNFDQWVSEKEEIHNTGKLQSTLENLGAQQLTYEQEQAVWLKSESLGDTRDRVLFKSNGRPTYLMGDIAYHSDKASRTDKMLNLWGADHTGQDVSLKLALKSLGVSEDKLDVLFLQLVSLQKDGQDVKMSKRTGTLITIEEVLDDVGCDAFRATMLTSNVNNRLIFDIDLVKQASEHNPAFYLQYSHARACSILRKASSPDPETGSVFFEGDYGDISVETVAQSFSSDLPLAERQATIELLLKLMFFPTEVLSAAHNLNPCQVLNYLSSLAKTFHSFYNTPCKVVDIANPDLSEARLVLVLAFQRIMSRGLDLLLISSPRQM